MIRDSDSDSTRELEAIERALDRLHSGWDPQGSDAHGDDEREVREMVEALAATAYSLDFEAPSAAVRQRILGAVTGSEKADNVYSFQRDPGDMTLQHAVASPTNVLDDEATDPGDMTLVGIGANGGVNGGANVVQPFQRSSSRGLLAMAAALALCLVGLGYLYGQLKSSQSLINSQQLQLAAIPQVENELVRTRENMQLLDKRLKMITRVAQKAYPMKTSSEPEATGAQGIVYVCGQHQQWYLSLTGLEPPPADMEYRLWFLTDDGPLDGGVVNVEDGAAGMDDVTMPDGTRGFEVSLEPAGGVDEPRGRLILVGDRPVKL